ncbi:MAG: response regulator [Planctomycetia bacterium]|nr:response regulator [Planctomycetia bacterium]
MPILLRALILEDVDADAELIVLELQRHQFEVDWQRVDTEADFAAQLRPGLDVVLADYTLPQFDALGALHLLRERGLDIPFILVTGTVGDEKAVECIKQGATDYILKDRMARLGPAVLQALSQRRLRLESAEALAELRRTDETLQTVIQASPLAIVVIDRACHVVVWNDTAEKLFGWKNDDVVGRMLPIIPLEQRAAFYREVAGEFEGEQRSGQEVQRLHQNGTLVDVTLWTSPLRNNQGEIVSILSMFADATGRKQLEQQFLQAQKLESIGRLAGGVAHDFNNLLTVISGFSEMMLGTLPENTLAGRGIREIRKAAERAALLTRQLLAFSRKEIAAPVDLDPNALIRDMDKMLRRLIGEDIDLICVLDPGLAPVRADPGQFEQILMNLTINARDAMPQGGQITIQTRNISAAEIAKLGRQPTAAAYVLLAIADTGVGMSAEIRSHIFEPFFTTKEPGKGTGLGLPTVYGIVTQNQGFLEVDSTPGQGTTFRIYWPAIAAIQPLGKSDPNLRRAALGSETVLLAEDEDGVRQLAAMVLKANGYTVLEARNGSDALEIVRQHPQTIHMLVTDVVMPRMNGQQLAEQSAAIRPEMRVIFITGYTDDSTVRQQLTKAGVTLVQKPFSPSDLVRKVREVLDQPR